MFNKKIEALSRYLVRNEVTSEMLMRYLALETFAYLETRTIYLAKLNHGGCLEPVDHFGFPDGVVESWGNFPMVIDMPVTAAVKRNEIISVRSLEEMYEKFPSIVGLANLDHDWAAVTSIPIHSFGVYAITTFKAPEIDEEHESFLRTIGQLVCFALGHARNLSGIVQKVKQKASAGGGTLTERQAIILKLILRGMTNSEIGEEIGFSDSLVRQESMAIYSALNVSGRKELIEREGKQPSK